MLLPDVKNEKIIFAALNWGKGHVARSIGLIQQLLAQGNELIIAGDDSQLAIFKVYFPLIEIIQIEPYPFEFSGNGNFSKDLIRSRKLLKKQLQKDRDFLELAMSELNFTLVISDHRYGFYSKKCTSIFVTHQLNLALNWWSKPAQIIHEAYLKMFDNIWVMDDSLSSLAGKLSKSKNRKHVSYIGHFSRFMNNNIIRPIGKLDVVICNGPQPYDEHLFLRYKNDLDKIIICPDHLFQKYNRKNLVSAKNWKVCDEVIMRATRIYAFCGYSTLMDLKFLTCDYQLIPTKGQTEQEYLFELMNATKPPHNLI